MADTTWPDPARPGVPLHPERTAAHWFDEGGVHLIPRLWLYGSAEWDPPPPAHARYVGPVLTPAEHAAALAAARMDERQRAAEVASKHRDQEISERNSSLDKGNAPAALVRARQAQTAEAVAAAILAQPAPTGADALAAMLTAAERRGIERAAAKFDNHYDDGRRIIVGKVNLSCAEARHVAAAIRALLEPPA